MNLKKRTVLTLTVMVATALALSACSGGGNKSNGAGSGAQQAPGKPAETKPLDVSVLSIYYQKEPPTKDNAVLKEVEKRTNTNLNITWVAPNNFSEKVNVTLASGDLPDLMLVTDIANASFRTMAKQGAFWDLTELIKSYPNLMKFPDITFSNTKIEGKLYGIPRVRPTEGNAQPLIRADWLTKLNLKMPETTEDLYKVMKAFKESAPDGQKDTIGLSGYVNQNDMGQFGFIENSFIGNSGKYKVVDGKITDMTFSSEMKQSLEWFRRAYKEGLIPQDFALLKHNQAKDLVFAGKAGIFPDKPNQEPAMVQGVASAVPSSKPDFAWMPYLIGPSGTKYAAKGNGHFGMFVISKKVPEDKVKKLLAFLDYGASDEGSDLANYGMKDVHFTLQGDNRVLTDAAKNDPSFQFMQNIFMKFDKYANVALGMTPELTKRDMAYIDAAEKVSIPSPLDGVTSPTAQKLGSDYDKKIQDMKTKVIMEKVTLGDWDQFVAALKADANYMKIQEEYNAEYQKKASSK
ncbi:type 2 periplasmic-binding domain-containing protein [Paenibacillus sp. MAH-36]|uniref:Extracellular solute-binding protein n=1 Tax=Paenibacillus violae TaxID=3077234 RepID=A0ABU3RD66_9BACL|nr:extracellular solute-binding protein [Paenibacillus sp. PFR10]MDU0202190.1 extracellular solute-binding protein [Paenibacillus sp. PFR10]